MGELQQSQSDLLHESLELFLSRGNELSAKLHENLRATNLEFRDLFARTDLSAHYAAFLGALEFVVRNYEHRPVLERTFRELGLRHTRYGARPEHFAVFGDCMLRAMGQLMGARWTLPLDLAWRTAFENMAEMMLDGASSDDLPRTARAG